MRKDHFTLPRRGPHRFFLFSFLPLFLSFDSTMPERAAPLLPRSVAAAASTRRLARLVVAVGEDGQWSKQRREPTWTRAATTRISRRRHPGAGRRNLIRQRNSSSLIHPGPIPLAFSCAASLCSSWTRSRHLSLPESDTRWNLIAAVRHSRRGVLHRG